jgi:hypothetical protein
MIPSPAARLRTRPQLLEYRKNAAEHDEGEGGSAIVGGRVNRSPHEFAIAVADRRVGKATGSRERAPDDRLRVPNIRRRIGGHGAKSAFAHPHMGRCESSVLIGWDRI